MNERGRLHWYIRFFRSLGRPLARAILRILYHISIFGTENVPRIGAYLVAPNHISLFEPPLIAAFWPKPLEAVGAKEVLLRPIQGQLMRLYGGIPVSRGEVDRAMLSELMRRLKAGLPALLFPEGGRSHLPGLRQGQLGVAYAASKANVPVIPVGLTGTHHGNEDWLQFRRPRVEITIGQAINLPPAPEGGPERRAFLKTQTERIMRALAQLLPENYRGIYRYVDYV
jgi:1-acyl-sn-glycerol-3-phosphate acyltransferase